MAPPLFGLGQVGKSVSVTAQRRLNLYAEVKPDGEKNNITYYGTPGLELFTSFGDTPIRGAIAQGDYIYCVHRGTFWQVDNAGVKTNRGSIGTTSGRVELACNGTQIVIVDGTNMYCYTIATHAFATVTSDLFDNPVSVCCIDSYFVAAFRNSQVFQISALDDGLTWDALEFDSAEYDPDNLVRVYANYGQLVLCGDLTLEFAANTGGQDFPFSKLKNSTIQFGLAAPWSLTEFNDSLAGLFRSKDGQVQVKMLRGGGLLPISTPDLDTVINGYATVSDATAFSYMLGGHPMLELNFPSEGKSHLFDGLTGDWSDLESGLAGGRHRAEIRVDFLNKPRVCDFENGNVYTISADTYTNNGAPIPREIITRRIWAAGKRITIPELEIFFEPGVGTSSGQGSDPQVMLQVSKDGGKTYGNELWRGIGRIGDYKARARWLRLCSGRDLVLKMRITDPVKVVLAGEFARVEMGNA